MTKQLYQSLPPAICLMGPTAAGKTDLALQIASKYPVEIISVDSALVYRGMDIGSAKPDSDTLSQYPHHLVDILEPEQAYSAGRFRADALSLMAEITARGRVPLLVGGTMLYFRSLIHGIADLPEADATIRSKLEAEADSHGLAHMHQRLQQIDPVAASRIHVNDPQRLQRALEVFELTGQTLTQLTQSNASSPPYEFINLVISPFDRRVLHQRIAHRYHKMLENGFIEEVRKLMARDGCHNKLPSMRAVGYRQAWAYLEGEYDQATFVERAIIATRQMAKRQLTWLRSQKDCVWFDSGPDLPVQDVLLYLSARLPGIIKL